MEKNSILSLCSEASPTTKRLMVFVSPWFRIHKSETVPPNDIANLFKDKLGLWLASTPEFDISGHLWNVNAPLAGGDWKHNLADFLSIAPDAPVALDAVYKNQDEEYLDACVLDRILHKDSRIYEVKTY